MALTVGSIVHYQLTDPDAAAINRRRDDACAHLRHHPRGEAGEIGATGHMMHYGSSVSAGQFFAAVIVRVFPGDARVNLSVLLDGTDTYWAPARAEGSQPGTWTTPPPAETAKTKFIADAQLDNWFGYHPPSTPAIAEAHETVRAECRRLAQVLSDLLPEGPHKTVALRAVHRVMLEANSCIATEQRLFEAQA